ncbi:tryptophan aminotransferase-related protein 3-like [Humulus lupulus]|uniref:tryptophan aminotransferase-related protein 3-like n=1 Tax=Humulus lupulus TaxID=3486 RepID=UPI002B40C424|nr:tryptophan aminotransferase-related protein 3-like [Humulus lupulus]
MGKATRSLIILILLLISVCSLTLNVLLIIFKRVRVFDDDELSWSRRAAKEAERVAAISCSGHGRAYMDSSLVVDEQPVCECNSCYAGSHCQKLLPSCPANADGGDPLFLEPFWMENAGSSAILVAGWHRMSYTFNQSSFMSKQLEARIRQMHAIVGNAVTEGKYIIFGTGSSQLVNAAIHALSPHNSSSPSIVVPLIPYYPLYKLQTEYFQEVDYKFEEDESLWMNKMNSYSNDNTTTTLIEIVTSPNNPDGQLNRARLQHPNAKAIYDRVYYWPHFTAISAPADDDIMLFSLSKLTGHAGSRLGWAVVKDETVFTRMSGYMSLNTMGVSHESQLRALHLMKVIIERKEGETIFDFGYKTMRNRWEKLNDIISLSKRFSLQKLESQYCNFFNKIRGPSPAYAWLKCLRKEEEKDCSAVLTAANINGRRGSTYGDEDKYVRLSLVRTQDDFDNLLSRVKILISEEDSAKSI